MTWKEAARRFRRRWRNVEHNWQAATRELVRWHISYRAAATQAARYSNQLAVVRTLVAKYRKREMNASEIMTLIETMQRENAE